jgi:serine/threonine protein kinase
MLLKRLKKLFPQSVSEEEAGSGNSIEYNSTSVTIMKHRYDTAVQNLSTKLSKGNIPINKRFTNLTRIQQTSSGTRCIYIGRRVNCSDNELPDTVALKMIKVVNEESMIRAENEVRTLSVCKHQNILQYTGTHAHFSASEQCTRIYIEMELCMGTLSSILSARNLQEYEISCLIRQILLGLNYLHEVKHICHGDLSIDNILIGSDYQPRISNFEQSCRSPYGLHYPSDDPLQKKQLVKAPEVYNAEICSFKSDIWSLGMILLELCTRVNPITQHKELFRSIIDKHSYNRFQKKLLSPIMKDLSDIYSPQLVDFLSSCLRFEQQSRPDTTQLLEHEFVTKYRRIDSNSFLQTLLSERKQEI